MGSKAKGEGGGGAWQLMEADDPADWVDSSFAFLREMDASLRCELCYNILTAPVSVKDCNHVFCSVCVRNAINQPDPHGHHCPKCMVKNVHDSSLLPQPIIEATAEAWKKARPELVKKREKEKGQRQGGSQSESSSRPMKRPRVEVPSSSPDNVIGRLTRSSCARQAEKKVEESIVIGSDSEGEGGNAEQSSNSGPALTRTDDGYANGNDDDKDYRSMRANDMVECPLCKHDFTLVALNQHLDRGTCQPGGPEPSLKERGLPTVKGGDAGSSSWFQRSGKQQSKSATATSTASKAAPRKKLARPNYSFLKEADVRRMLDDFRLGTTGPLKRLVERHRQWVTLYNANLDASEKVQKSDVRLRKELGEWERGQDDGQRRGKAMTEERAKAWEEKNRDQFRDLEKRARESHLKNKAAHQKTLADGDEDGQVP